MSPISSLLLGSGFQVGGAMLYGGVHTHWLHWRHDRPSMCIMCVTENPKDSLKIGVYYIKAEVEPFSLWCTPHECK